MTPRSLLLRLLLGSSIALVAPRLGAQVVERPEPFDSAGRITAITPATAARLQLMPPAWRITGAYEEARLFAVSDSEYVIVVRRPDGAVERYPINRTYRDYLRARTSLLPPARTTQVATELGKGGAIDRATRNRFIVDQSLLGLAVYAPAFAVAVSDGGAGQTASWLLISGLTFFGASQYSSDFPITRAQNALSTHAALHGAAGMAALFYALGAGTDARAAGALLGGIGGTVGGLWIGRRIEENTARVAGFGSDLTLLLTQALLVAGGLESGDNRIHPRTRAAVLVGAGAVGYPLGLGYAKAASYNITGGDTWALWIGGGIGALAASPFIAEGTPGEQAIAAALTAGGVVGLVAADRFLVRRYDHTRGEAFLLGLGAAAGGLMGGGVYYLVDPDTEHDAVGLSMAAAGAVGGLLVAQRLFPPLADQKLGTARSSSRGSSGSASGRWARGAARVSLSLPNAALLAAGARGPVPLASVRF